MSDSERIEFLVREIAELKGVVSSIANAVVAPAPTPEVLTREQAMDYVRIIGHGITKARLKAFYRWRSRHKIRGKSRYSRGVLDLALAREAGVVRMPASLRRQAA